MVTVDQLKATEQAIKIEFRNAVIELKKEIEGRIDEKLDTIIDKLNHTATSLEEAVALSKSNEDKIQNLDFKVETLISDHRELVQRCTALERNLALEHQKVEQLEDKLEDRTNRSLRKTLVIKGVPDKVSESWNETENKLAEIFAENLSEGEDEGIVSFDDAKSMIERAHRGRPSKVHAGAPRPIYVALYDWKQAEAIKEAVRTRNRKDKHYKIYVDQMYGARTTFQRNEALKRRKFLKASGAIYAGYVKFPAQLMVKYRSTDEKYFKKEDFSSMKLSVGAELPNGP